VDGEPVAQFGQLHPQVAANRKLRQEVFLAEIFADRLNRHPLREVLYQPLPRFPGV
jgi:phenylalanyl-tRNA synthetase beta subunit